MGKISEISEGLLDYLAVESKNVKTPFIKKQFFEKYIMSSGVDLSVRTLERRMYKYYPLIQKSNKFDTETKVKMVFALSIPIGSTFLDEVKKDAEVEIDDLQRIVKYKKYTGLKLSGNHRGHGGSFRGNNRVLLERIAQKALSVDKPQRSIWFMEGFSEFDDKREYKNFKEKFCRVRRAIFESTILDLETKIHVMFVTGAKVKPGDLQKIRKNGHVEVDNLNRITKYSSNDGNLNLAGDHPVCNQLYKQMIRRNFDEDSDESVVVEDEFCVFDESMNQNFSEIQPFQASNTEKINRNSSEDSPFTDLTEFLKLSEMPAKRIKLEEFEAQKSIIRDENEQIRAEIKEEYQNFLFNEIEQENSELKFLEAFQSLILSHDSPILDDVKKTIQMKIEKARMGNEEIPINYILIAFESCLLIASRSASTNLSIIDSINLKEFLQNCHQITSLLPSPELSDFQQKLTEMIREDSSGEKRIPMAVVKSALETALVILVR